MAHRRFARDKGPPQPPRLSCQLSRDADFFALLQLLRFVIYLRLQETTGNIQPFS